MRKALLPICVFFLVTMWACESQSQSEWQAAPTQIEVVASGTSGTLTVFSNSNGKRQELLRTDAYVGRNGCSTEKREGDGKTPVGMYEIRRGFGLATPPAVNIAYTRLTGKELWVDDVASTRYNQWVTADVAPKDWNSAENLSKELVAYKYAAVVEYNTASIVKGAGSAIFLHCSEGKPTSGCISVPEEAMVKILGLMKPGTRIAIARTDAELKKIVE